MIKEKLIGTTDGALRWSAKLILVVTTLAFLFDSSANAQTEGLAAAKKPKTKAVASARKSTQYLRMTKDDRGEPLAMQTAITRFQNADKSVIVDLIAAVHIGEGSYYAELGEQFTLYDSVLYELVAPDGAAVPDGKPRRMSGNPLAFLQQSAQSMLGLESQLEKINYRRSNFVHADLSPAEMSAKMSSRGESAWSIGLSAFSEIMERQAGSGQAQELSEQLGDTGLFELLDNPLKLKRLMASQFANEEAMRVGLGTKLNEMLIADRNEEAMRVLHKELKSGKKHVAIFYGAAHMTDFEKRLRDEMKMTKTAQIWVTAWDLTTAKESGLGPAAGLLKWLGGEK